MNREEAKKIFGELLLFGKAPCKKEELEDLCKIVLAALDQEPTTKNDLVVDAISRQALLNATVKKNSIWNHITNSGGDNLEAIISKLPPVTPQEPRWIPVSEYLPVTNDEVLVTYIVNGNTKKRYVETANCFDGEWSSVNDEYRIPNTKIEIIAWCEMPKPYREVKE